VNEWWKTFFDDDYLRIWGQLLSEENNAKQAAELWSMLDLRPGCQILDAPCGWGRLSRPLALLGATVLGVDQSETLLAFAARNRGELPPGRLRYLTHDLRTPLPETGFDVACNIFTSFGYGRKRRTWPSSGRCEVQSGCETITRTEESITRLFAEQGIRILRQERAPIRLRGETLNLIGVDDSLTDLQVVSRW
jgi:hypothetical protein